MKPRYLSVACIITAFSMMILMAALPLIAPQQAHASPLRSQKTCIWSKKAL